ncbi:hypothetical protein ACRQ5Q_22180 [Bradyrhizobium sp. PMVTL-01]|uniref:hypothetical protein n=1 Tax=Bradyrhizobium sp. PMVTL-01 TaxID=3434999 RepID=UPI003F6EEB00
MTANKEMIFGEDNRDGKIANMSEYQNHDPRSYLETEARIIAESETHIAISLRVEKAVIARYLPLMAALANISPSAVKRVIPHKLI